MPVSIRTDLNLRQFSFALPDLGQYHAVHYVPGSLLTVSVATLVAGNVEVMVEDREMEFRLVDAKLVSPIAISQDISDGASRVPSGQTSQTALQALDMILAQADLNNQVM